MSSTPEQDDQLLDVGAIKSIHHLGASTEASKLTSKKELRNQLYERDGKKCHYCGLTRAQAQDDKAATLEWVMPGPGVAADDTITVTVGSHSVLQSGGYWSVFAQEYLTYTYKLKP